MITETKDNWDDRKEVRLAKIGEQNRNQIFNKNPKQSVCYYYNNKGHIRRDCFNLKLDKEKLVKSGNLPSRSYQSTHSTQTDGSLRSKGQENIYTLGMRTSQQQ